MDQTPPAKGFSHSSSSAMTKSRRAPESHFQGSEDMLEHIGKSVSGQQEESSKGLQRSPPSAFCYFPSAANFPTQAILIIRSGFLERPFMGT